MVSQLNTIYKAYCSLGLPLSAFDPILVAHANMRYIHLHPELPDAELEELLALVTELTGGLAMAPSWETTFFDFSEGDGHGLFASELASCQSPSGCRIGGYGRLCDQTTGAIENVGFRSGLPQDENYSVCPLQVD
jgi:hypothetical protein